MTRKELSMQIKVLGPGCPNCETLQARTEEAVRKAGIDVTITKVADYDDMLFYGILRTPGLVIDEKLVVSGRLPTVDEITKLIADAKAGNAT